MCVVMAALVSAGSITLVSLPRPRPTSGILTIGCVSLTSSSRALPMFGLMIVYSGVLIVNVVSTARQFIAHSRDRIELREQGEIIKLLREFEAIGIGRLVGTRWRSVLTSKCRGRAPRSKRPREEQVIGLHYSRILDPRRQIAPFSSACAACSATWKAERRSATAPFRRPTERWWSISAKPIHDEKASSTGWRGVASDITDARLSGNDAVRAARTDPLTGLANRLLVRELLEEAVLRQWENQRAARCCWSISTASSWSTTRSAMRSATSCWWKSAGGWKPCVGDGRRYRPHRRRRVRRRVGRADAIGSDCERGGPDHCRPVKASRSAPQRCMSARPSASPSARPTALSKSS